MRIQICLVAVMVGGCDPTPDISNPCNLGLELEAAPTLSQRITLDANVVTDQCPLNGCGGNSPVVGGVYFDRLYYMGPPFKPNPEGVEIVSVVSPPYFGSQLMKLELIDQSLQPSNNGDQLRGVIEQGNPVSSITGTSLVGTEITVSVESVKGLQYYKIVITDVGRTPFWVKAKTETDFSMMTTYTFQYTPLPDERPLTPLCSHPPKEHDTIHAVAFGGDQYDPKTKAVTVGSATNGWFNIACANSAVFKTQSVAYTQAAQQRLGIKTSVEQRHAMLNAWTANVCGTGLSFTAPGEQITLQESLGVFKDKTPYTNVPDSVEAIWNEYGAVCLNVPRRIEDEPDICTRITMECSPNHPILPCDANLVASWSSQYYVLTGNLPP